MYVHVTLVPFVGPRNEMKTKPTQHSVRDLRNIGITPDVLICRTKHPMSEEMKRKIALFCDIAPDGIVEGLDTDTLYKLPLIFEEQNFCNLVTKRLGLEAKAPDLSEWQRIVQAVKNPTKTVNVAICGKYLQHDSQPDTYISVVEALKHGGLENDAHVEIKWVDSESYDGRGDAIAAELQDVDAIVVPGGFGTRGIEGKIAAIRHARENKIPFLGLCLGLQCAVIEYARHEAKLEGAHSTEFDADTPHPVIAFLKGQRDVSQKGGTMRLGTYPCSVAPDSLAHELYGQSLILERHRHRYEVNPRYHRPLLEAGLKFSGTSPDERLVEMIEIEDHPFFIASQFHPEFKSRPTRAHPLFRGLIAAAVEQAGHHEREEPAADVPSPEQREQSNGHHAQWSGTNGTGEPDEDDDEALMMTLDDIRRRVAEGRQQS